MTRLTTLVGAAFLSFSLISCGGGGSDGGGSVSGGSSGADFGCDGACAQQALSAEDVNAILTDGVSAATQAGVSATIAVLDRVGNVLAVYQMSGANPVTQINGQIGAVGGLEGAVVPAKLAAISKAGTGAYLSSQGNAFSTRTASQIIQENFNPGNRNQPGGPLFGVQFSQLPCSDVTTSTGTSAGPHGLPLGLSADSGGFPLYKQGVVVGGVGVESNGIYTLDRDITDTDDDVEERIALAASKNFAAPSERLASRISAGGRSLRYSDVSYQDLFPAESVALVPANFITPVSGGTFFGSAASGVVDTMRAGIPAGNLVTAGGAPRYPTRSGSSLGGQQLTGPEVDAILNSALITAYRSRAAIRQPLDSGARVSIWVVDQNGTPLGFTRSQDAPVFGIDVALQKARTAAFFSSGDILSNIGGYGARLAQFAPGIAGKAVAARSVGNMARPFYTDGINGNGPGPLSLPFPGSGGGSTWSPFNTGLELDLVAGAIVAGLTGNPSGCASSRIANGIQIFPGGVPLYRGSVLIGAIGVSGDGVDQDDMTAYYGASHQGLDYVGQGTLGDPLLGFNAPPEMRADTLELAVPDTRLRYVNCPEAPFVESNEQNVCEEG